MTDHPDSCGSLLLGTQNATLSWTRFVTDFESILDPPRTSRCSISLHNSGNLFDTFRLVSQHVFESNFGHQKWTFLFADRGLVNVRPRGFSSILGAPSPSDCLSCLKPKGNLGAPKTRRRFSAHWKNMCPLVSILHIFCRAWLKMFSKNSNMPQNFHIWTQQGAKTLTRWTKDGL